MEPRFPFDDLLLFTQHIGSAMKLGLPLHQTVELLSGEMANRTFRKTLADVAVDLKTGSDLFTALNNHRDVFPEYYLRVLRAGEEAGSLPETMEQLADILQHNFVLGQKLKKAFAYPVLILGVLGMMGLTYTLTILPQFNSVMREIKTSADYLGLATTVHPSLPPDVGQYLPVVFSGVILLMLFLFFVAKRFIRAGWCGLVFDKIDLNLPFLGVFTRYAIASRLSRALASILRCGIPLPEALGLCAGMMENKVARAGIEKTRETVEKGETLGTAMLSESIFPPSLVWMLSAAEVRGDFLGALDQLAEFYQVKVETTASWMVEILEPILILLVGLVFIIVSLLVFSPILTLYGSTFNLVG